MAKGTAVSDVVGSYEFSHLVRTRRLLSTSLILVLFGFYGAFLFVTGSYTARAAAGNAEGMAVCALSGIGVIAVSWFLVVSYVVLANTFLDPAVRRLRNRLR